MRFNLIDRDVVLTAIVVIPASFAWIVTERTWIALFLAACIYVGMEYGYPAVRDRNFDIQPFIRFYNQMREMISRKVRRA